MYSKPTLMKMGSFGRMTTAHRHGHALDNLVTGHKLGPGA